MKILTEEEDEIIDQIVDENLQIVVFLDNQN